MYVCIDYLFMNIVYCVLYYFMYIIYAYIFHFFSFVVSCHLLIYAYFYLSTMET